MLLFKIGSKFLREQIEMTHERLKLAMYHFLGSVLWIPAPGLSEKYQNAAVVTKLICTSRKKKLSLCGSYRIIMSILCSLTWPLTENSQQCENFTGHDILER